ncbi:hypothetical protein MMC11_008118 [Xylographa trunciseda]|nr:hypothetical protein [Xylographa trunciseda]
MVLSTLNQSFAFHASPESFISTRLQDLSITNPDLVSAAASRQKIIEASILNRKVHIISSYQLCKSILQGSGTASEGAGPSDATSTFSTEIKDTGESTGGGLDTFAVGPAYRQLMADFFPPPNILLEDGDLHARNKDRWKQQLSTFPADVTPLTRDITKEHMSTLRKGSSIDLYENLKDLSWKILLGIFLNLDAKDDAYSTIENAQESLLRGQFSLFPVAVNMPFWQSPRSKGIKARCDLQTILREQVEKQLPSCPLLRQQKIGKDEMSSHCLLFTSSIANKALASLLTATIINLFLLPSPTPLAAIVRSHPAEHRGPLLESILLETERLSPPVVGVMRRLQKDMKLSLPETEERHHVQAGHDVWLYLAGANRDPTIFSDAEKFVFDRFMDSDMPRGFAFGFGNKTCLGSEIVHQIVSVVATVMIDADITLRGDVSDLGVKGWLGWETGVPPSAFASDLKQLPCQRPRKPVLVNPVLVNVGSGLADQDA